MAATVPPEYIMVPLPSVAVSVPPEQLFTALPGVATSIPAGRVSVNASDVAANWVAAVLSMVNVSVLTPSTAIAVGLNALLKLGAGSTTSVSEAVPLLPDDEVRSPVVLTWLPTVDDVVSTEMVQLAPVATVPPL